MYLKRLEMAGFKSFADRTTLEFEPGVVGVVGPNGCGKSNVVDAIRWCLGEMSAKSLRSKQLIDVIFNGSANRAPSNLSEVSLTFDNAERRLPIDFSEVTVTRRLFRSGESEYLMNKTQCRLRDIHELFLDTGIGEEGYSIMEQGRVEYILSAKPEDRRELFEEAAGVSKYKARREEALRKIERTQIDLDRLSDVIRMTKEQMDKIEAAVRKAKQYQKLFEDLRALEISHWLWDVSQGQEEMKTLRAQLEKLQIDLQAKITLIDQQEAQLSEIQRLEVGVSENLFSRGQKISEVDGKIALAEQRMATAEERMLEIRVRDEALDIEMAQIKARLESIVRERAQVESALASESVGEADIQKSLDAAAAAYQRAQEEQNKIDAEAIRRQSDIWNLSQEETNLYNQKASLISHETRYDSEIERLAKDFNKAKIKKEEALTAGRKCQEDLAQKEKEFLAITQQSQNLKISLKDHDALLGTLTEKLNQLSETYYQMKAELDVQQEKLGADPYHKGAAAILAAGISGIAGPLGRLVTIPRAEDEPYVRHVLGAHMNDLIAQNLHDAKNALMALGDESGRARFLVLDQLTHSYVAYQNPQTDGGRRLLDMVTVDPAYQPVLHFLLGHWISDGATLYGEGVVEGGHGLGEIQGQDNLRFQTLQKQVGELKEQLESLQQEKSRLQNERQDYLSQWESVHASLESARANKEQLRKDLEKWENNAALFEEEILIIGAEAQKFEKERGQTKLNCVALEEPLARLTEKVKGLKDGFAALQESLTQSRAVVMEQSSELAVAKERASGFFERVEWRKKQLTGLDQENTSLEESLARKGDERSSSSLRISEQETVKTDSAQAIREFNAERQIVERELNELHSEKQVLYDKSAEITRLLDETREAADNLRAEEQNVKVKATHFEMKWESMESRMRDKYSLGLDEAREKFPVQQAPGDPTDLDRLKKRVENYGAVNLAAPEEFTQLEERYKFLVTQEQDLLKAKEDLLNTIQKINATTKDHFRDTFARVRENFKLLYGQLFSGGVCDLRLTDESDILNTGIEIYAQPPGKKLQNITLLSGGEKALTAVSLLFAFFMVRPSPLAILDEVDAPLDEANVTRFVSLIRTFTHQSQFLLITHNKRSMELADMLFGVTMETLGVSNILSVKLKKEGAAKEADVASLTGVSA